MQSFYHGTQLYPFPNHPFKVPLDEALSELAVSNRGFGVMTPALVHLRKEGGPANHMVILFGKEKRRKQYVSGVIWHPRRDSNARPSA